MSIKPAAGRVGLVALGEAKGEYGPFLVAEEDQCAVSAGLASTLTRNALLYQAAAKIGVNQAAIGLIDGGNKRCVIDPFTDRELGEPAVLVEAGSLLTDPGWPIYASMNGDARSRSACQHRSLNRGSDRLRRLQQVRVLEMGVPRSGFDRRMPEQPTDHGHALPAHHGVAGVCVPRTVQPNIFHASHVSEFRPRTVDRLDRSLIAPVPEDRRILAAAWEGYDQVAVLVTQPYGSWDGLWAGLAVPEVKAEAFDVGPVKGQNFTDPASGQDELQDRRGIGLLCSVSPARALARTVPRRAGSSSDRKRLRWLFRFCRIP